MTDARKPGKVSTKVEIDAEIVYTERKPAPNDIDNGWGTGFDRERERALPGENIYAYILRANGAHFPNHKCAHGHTPTLITWAGRPCLKCAAEDPASAIELTQRIGASNHGATVESFKKQEQDLAKTRAELAATSRIAIALRKENGELRRDQRWSLAFWWRRFVERVRVFWRAFLDAIGSRV